MKRLRDAKGTAGRELTFASELLDAVPPLRDSPERMRRVALALAHRGAPRRSTPRWLAAVAIAGLLGVMATAGATIGRGWWRPTASVAPALPSLPERRPGGSSATGARPVALSPALPVAPPAPEKAGQRTGALIGSTTGSAMDPRRSTGRAPEVVRVEVAAKRPVAVEASAPSVRLVPVEVGPPPAAAETDGKLPLDDDAPTEPAGMNQPARRDPPPPSREEAALVAQAIRALRTAGDAARAATLLDEYLRRFPGGPLTEEALALAIEAHAGRDHGRAATLARDYIARYPDGQYAETARRVLRRPPPVEGSSHPPAPTP